MVLIIMKKQDIYIQAVKIVIFIILGYFIYIENGWALAVAMSLVGILAIEIVARCRNCEDMIYQNLDLLHTVRK